MSLDVYLRVKEPQLKKTTSGIFIRENGQTKEITEDEWNAKFPDKTPVRINKVDEITDELYHANITHNLGKMAAEVGIYKVLWRPEENGITTAKQLIEPLEKGIEKMVARSTHYKKFDSENGWGTFNQFLPFLLNYLKACRDYPDASIEVDR